MSDNQAELAKEFRCMLVWVANELTVEQMSEIGFIEGHPNLLEPPPGSHGFPNIRVHFLHKLEAMGLFSPINPDYLITILERISREDLVQKVAAYKQNPLFLKAKKNSGKEKRKKSKAKKDSKTISAKEKHADIISKLKSSVDNREKFEHVFALGLTHATSLINLLEEIREVLHETPPQSRFEDITHKLTDAFARFTEEEETVEALSSSMRKVLSASGLLSGSSSSSSEESCSENSFAQMDHRTKGETGPPLHPMRYTKQKEENNTLKSAAHTFSRRPYQNESVPVIPNFAHLLRSEGKAQMVTGRERLTRNGKATPPPTSPKPSRRQRQARNSPLLVSTPQQAMLQDTATSQEVKENLYEEIDFTGGTGDSGIGSGGGERSAWISHLPDRLGSQSMNNLHLYENLAPRPGEYMPLVSPQPSRLAEYCLPQRLSKSSDNILASVQVEPPDCIQGSWPEPIQYK